MAQWNLRVWVPVIIVVFLTLAGAGWLWWPRDEVKPPPPSTVASQKLVSATGKLLAASAASSSADDANVAAGAAAQTGALETDVSSDRSFVLCATEQQWQSAMQLAAEKGQQPADIEIIEFDGRLLFSGIFIDSDAAVSCEWNLPPDELEQSAENLIDFELYAFQGELRCASIRGPLAVRRRLCVVDPEHADSLWGGPTRIAWQSPQNAIGDLKQDVLDYELGRLQADGDARRAALVIEQPQPIAEGDSQKWMTLLTNLNNVEFDSTAIKRAARGQRLLEVEAEMIQREDGLYETRFSGLWLAPSSNPQSSSFQQSNYLLVDPDSFAMQDKELGPSGFRLTDLHMCIYAKTETYGGDLMVGGVWRRTR